MQLESKSKKRKWFEIFDDQDSIGTKDRFSIDFDVGNTYDRFPTIAKRGYTVYFVTTMLEKYAFRSVFYRILFRFRIRKKKRIMKELTKVQHIMPLDHSKIISEYM